MRPTTVLYQPQPWGEAWKILCFCLPGCQDYEVHQINLKLKLIGRKKKGKRSSYNFNLWKLRKTIWRMDLGVKFQNPLQKTSFCRQQDTHHSPVAEQLLVFSRHSYWNATNGSIFGPPFKDTFGGRAGVPMASSTLSLCLLHPERWQWLQRSPPERSPSPQLLLPSLNGLSTEAARSKDLRWCPLFSPPLTAQHFLYALGFLPPYPANAKYLISKSLPCLVKSYSILPKPISSRSQSQASCLQDGLSSAYARCVCREMK